MDWKYLLSLLSFSVGFAAGFQAIYDRFKRESGSAMQTRYGLGYVLIRGLVPALVFVSGYAAHYFRENPVLWAFACGTGLEVVVRAKFYIKEEKRDGRDIDLLKGPFDLLHWIQNWVLEETATSLARARKRFVKDNLPGDTDFLTLSQKVLSNRRAFEHQPEIMQAIEAKVQELQASFHASRRRGRDAAELDRLYLEELGYAILKIAGPRSFDTLTR